MREIVDWEAAYLSGLPVEGKNQGVESSWEICCDGWYPCCKACAFEPSWNFQRTLNEIDGHWLPERCPKCGATMMNWREL